MKLIETIIRIVNEEVYSPASKKYEPGRYIAHKSNPTFRENIKLTGLQTSVGDCYKQFVGDQTPCKEAIFATDSENKEEMFDSTYDDDIWIIDTECAGVQWYKDRHFDDGDYQKHIVTFNNISPDCVKLIYKGTGGDVMENRTIVKENKVIDTINNMGIYDAVRYFGGYDKLRQMMGDYELSKEEKITFVKEIVEKLCEEYDDVEIGGPFFSGNWGIIYDETYEEKQIIEFYRPEYIIVERFTKEVDGADYDYDDFYLGSFEVPYEKLTHSLIDKIFNLMLSKITKD